MLSDVQLELLTAFVDGELDDRRRQAVLQLLHESSEARSMLGQLQENAHRLRELPREKLDTAFAGKVLQAIAEKGLIPGPAVMPAILPLRRRMPVWLRWSAAAAMLLVAVLGSWGAYRFLFGPDKEGPGPMVEHKDPPAPPPQPEEKALEFAFQDLRDEAAQQLLVEELKKEPAVRLAVTVRDQKQAVSRLQDALKHSGVKLLVDSTAQGHLQEGRPKTQYFVYAENLRPDEVTALLQKLSDQPQTEANFDKLLVTSLTGDDRVELSNLLGIDPEDLKPPPRVAFTDPIPAQPEPRKKAKAKKAAPQPERLALVLAQEPSGNISPQIQAFLKSRREQRPGTMQLLLVLQQA